MRLTSRAAATTTGLLAVLLSLDASCGVSAATAPCNADTVGKFVPAGSNATLVSATVVGNNGTYGPAKGADPDFPSNATGLPSLCAVEFRVTGESNSQFTFGMYLPDTWNGRMMGAGNTGFGGGIDWTEMAPLVQYGFATISTDTGHLSGPNSAGWAMNHPIAQANWGYVAMHTSVVLGKQVISAYYGKNASYSYFSACSGGGRQGLKDIQLYPEDFDGVVAGAAPWLLSHLHPWAVQVALPNVKAKQTDNVTDAAFQLFNNEVMRQCDPQDGHTDMVISDPYGCKFDYSQITCNSTSTNTSTCLTQSQVDILKATYADWVDKDNNNAMVYPAFTIASDASGLAGHAGAPSSFGTEYVANFVANDSKWDWSTINASTVRLADSLNPGSANADLFDLSTYRQRGGKLLTYHGLADPLIPPATSISYYEAVLEAMGGPKAASDKSSGSTSGGNNSTSQLDDFFRMFLVPGMHHCSGSNSWAPWYFAGGGQKAPGNTTGDFGVPGFADPQHDVVLAVMAWVENGTAPDSITATLWHNDDAAQGVKSQRPLCPYPAQAVLDSNSSSSSNGSDTSAWSCQRKDFVGIPSIQIAKQGSADPPVQDDKKSNAAKTAFSWAVMMLGSLGALFFTAL